MEAWGIARALHVLGVVLWIGGVSMVTTVLLPAVRRVPDNEAMALFERLERRFARQSRWTTALVGVTGFYLVHALDLWQRYSEPRYWWMGAMLLVWALFTLMLFVLEPLVLHRWLSARARSDPPGTLRIVERMHWFLLALSLVTVAGAVAGSHGVLLFSAREAESLYV
jgi:uncharacterized membrane protein